MAYYLTTSDALRTSTPLDRDGYYRIEWGDGPSYSIICDEKNMRHEYTRHNGAIIGVAPLARRSNTFVTIGLDHKIEITTTSGRQLLSLQGHTARILGIIEIDDKTLLSASEDGVIRLWNSQSGAEIAVICAAINQLSQIKMLRGYKQFAACEETRVTIWDIYGAQITSLFDVSKELESIRLLSSGCWLLSCQHDRPGIWSALGEHLTTFPFPFDIATELYELNNQQLLIRRSAKELTLWDETGTLLATHSASPKMVTVFDQLNQGVNQAEEQIRSKPDVIDYPHIKNPLGNKHSRLNVRQQLTQQQIDLHNPTRRLFWDFFSRPLFSPIKNVMQDIISSAHEQLAYVAKARHQAQQQLTRHRKQQSTQATWSWSWFILALVAGGFAMAAYIHLPWALHVATQSFHVLAHIPTKEQAQVVSLASTATGSVLLLLSFISLLKNRHHQRAAARQQANLTILATLPDEFNALITHIKQYRRNLLNDIPLRKNPQLLSGEAVKSAILQQVEGPLQQMALNECGITREEVIVSKHQTLILRDWALIQNQEYQSTVGTVNTSNELSFWSADGETVFAVQFIQYIFLTQNKIDVFTTYYDFIAGKCMAQETHAFFYNNIANTAKRQVQRTIGAACNPSHIPATEIYLAAASGDKMALTILNNESIAALIASARDNQDQSIIQRIEQIEEDKRQLENSASLSDKEKQEELDYLSTEISNLKNQTLEHNSQQQMHNTEQAIRHIHAQMQRHKSAESITDVAC